MNDLTKTKNLPRSKLQELYDYVDKNETNMSDALREAVAIPTLSQDEKCFPDITKMLKLCQTKINDLGATTELIESKNVKTPNGTTYPPVLFGILFINEELKTICVYGHVDTLLANNGETSSNENFDLIVKNGKMYGLGVSRGKGPLYCWLNALKIYVVAKIDIPVNIKFIIEGIAELNSPVLDDVLSRKKDFFHDVDYTCLTIDEKIDDIPCLRYGYRGVCHFSLDINCGENDIDSGKYGGAFDQPLMDAVRAVSSLMDKHDKLDFPNISRDVVAPSLREKKIIEKFEPYVDVMKKKIGVDRLRHKDNASRVVIHATRLPSISIHGFETSTNHSTYKNRAIIPCRAVVKFSIRLVKDQKSQDTRANVENHLRKVRERQKSVNEFGLKMDMGIDPWKEDPTNVHYKAAANAIKLIFGKEPLYVCDGSSLAAASILKSVCPQSSSLVLSLSEPKDSTENIESVPIKNYLNSVKLIMAYMCYVHEL